MHISKIYWIGLIFILIGIVLFVQYRVENKNNQFPRPGKGKKTFLAVYDYGMGGVWLLIDATSKNQVEALYPELTVFEDRPDWMDPKRKKEFIKECMAAKRYWDIDDSPTEFLRNLIQERTK